ncbi:hypothetical protein [Trueperella pyogenes]|uniref:hypothetical protein n=1 Tax=Trueperella pyogenes TaxID=1661 RepID=UPI00345DCFBD
MTHTSENQIELGVHAPDPVVAPERAWYRRWQVIAIAVVATLGLAGGGAAYAYSSALAGARASYETAVSQAHAAFDELDQMVDTARKLSADCSEKIAGDVVCEELAGELEGGLVRPGFDAAQDLGRDELRQGQSRAEEAIKAAHERTLSIKDRIEAVKAAMTVAEQQTAHEELEVPVESDEPSDVSSEQPIASSGQSESTQTGGGQVSAKRAPAPVMKGQAPAPKAVPAPKVAQQPAPVKPVKPAPPAEPARPAQPAPQPAPAPAPAPAPKPERTIIKAYAVCEGGTDGKSTCYHEIYWSDGEVEKRPIP